jgi:hypothetical protein
MCHQTEIKPTSPPEQETICECCGETTVFVFIGVQKWPEQLALVMGISTDTLLWQCSQCHTTITRFS